MRYNAPFLHLLKHQKKYLVTLALLLLLIPIMLNKIKGKPLPMGAESYHYLLQVPHTSSLLSTFVPNTIISVIPLVLGILFLLLLFAIAKEIKLGETLLFFWMAFFIVTPAFLHSFSIISGYGFFAVLSLGGIWLLCKGSRWQYFSLLLFIPATFIDGFSTLLLISAIAVYAWKTQWKRRLSKRKWIFPTIIIPLALFVIFLQQNLLLKQPFFMGPFHEERFLPDLISDLGGLSGISLFLIILFIIGVALLWKRKSDSVAYLFLLPLLPAYFFSTQTILLLSLLISFFAAVGMILIFERDWAVPFLKNFTLFLLLISIAFSSATYLQRMTFEGPYAGDQQALSWIKDNTGGDEIVFSVPENGPLIRYFAQREPFFSLQSKNNLKKAASETILNSTYTATTFPLLNEHLIQIVYITPQMKKAYPPEQGLLFLLKNERFKILYESEGYEVWSFKRDLS